MHGMIAGPRIARAVLVTITALLAAALISACGSSKSTIKDLDTAHVALAIQESIFEQRHIHATVRCPPTVLQEPGKNFVCIATTRSKGVARTTSFAVTQHNNGYVTYHGQ